MIRITNLSCEKQSGVQLSAAAIQADVEGYKADNRGTLEALEELGLRASPSLFSIPSLLGDTNAYLSVDPVEEAKGIDAAVDALWTKEEGEGKQDDGAMT